MPNRVEFKPPEGLEIPEGSKPDSKLVFVAEFKLKKDGKLCLVEIDGHPMPGYEDDDDESYSSAATKAAYP